MVHNANIRVGDYVLWHDCMSVRVKRGIVLGSICCSEDHPRLTCLVGTGLRHTVPLIDTEEATRTKPPQNKAMEFQRSEIKTIIPQELQPQGKTQAIKTSKTWANASSIKTNH